MGPISTCRGLTSAALLWSVLGLTGCATTQETQQNPDQLLMPGASSSLADPDQEQKDEVKLAVAQTFDKAGNVDEAISAYAVFLESGDNAHAAHRLAVLCDTKGEHTEARKWYETALEQGASRARVLCDYGYSLYLQGDCEQAEPLLREALSLKQDFPRAHTNLGLVLARQGQIPEAMVEFRSAGCDEAAARVNVAHVFVQQRRFPEAVSILQEALRVNPQSAKAADMLAGLEQKLADRATSVAARPNSRNSN